MLEEVQEDPEPPAELVDTAEASLQAEVEQLREVRPFSSSRLSRSRASC